MVVNTLNPKFHLGQRIFIYEPGVLGRVSEINFTYGGFLYKVEYWKEAEPKSAWCRDEELCPPTVSKETVGLRPSEEA